MTSGIATAADRFVSFHNGDLLLNPGKTVAAYLDPKVLLFLKWSYWCRWIISLVLHNVCVHTYTSSQTTISVPLYITIILCSLVVLMADVTTSLSA